METVSIAKLKAHLSAYLEKTRDGASVLILERGRPVGMLSPFRPADDSELWTRALEKDGLIRPPTQTSSSSLSSFFEDGPRVEDPEGRLRRALDEERQK